MIRPAELLTHFQRILSAYDTCCRELCRELAIPRTAFDILLFLANNPDCSTARDIVEIRGIKANLVSVNVDKLVRAGYLARESVPGDRRKILLRPTEQAAPIIDRGRRMQQDFFAALLKGVSPELLEANRQLLAAITRNAAESFS